MDKLLKFSIEEYKKLVAKTRIKVLLLLAVIFVALVGLICIFIDNKTGVNMVIPGQFQSYILMLLTGLILPVLTVFIAAELFTAEFADGTIKNLFALPVSKGIIYVGKLIAGAAAIGTFLLALGISSLAVSIVTNGTGAFGSFGGFVAGYLGTFFFLVTVLAMTGFLSLLTGSTGMAILMNILLWLALGVTGTFVPAAERFLPTSFTDWYQPLINGSNAASALSPMLFMISYFVVFAAAGSMLFERKEV